METVIAPKDAADLLVRGGRPSIHDARPMIRSATAPRSDLQQVITAPDLINMAFPPREPLLGSWLFPEDRMNIHGPRGAGKTHFGMAMSLAVSAGPEGPAFLGWTAPRAVPVLYVDFELGPRKLQKILRDCTKATRPETPVTDRFNLVPMHPRIRDRDGLARLDDLIAEIKPEVLVIDSHAFAFGVESENDAAEWAPYADWINSLAARGVAYIGLRHDGLAKGRARGTTAQEDSLDLVLGLERRGEAPAGINVALKWSKTRNLTPGDVETLRVKLTSELREDGSFDPSPIWTWELDGDAELDTRAALIVNLRNGGMSFARIAKELSMPKTSVRRAYQRGGGK
jgi:hypothetical protein